MLLIMDRYNEWEGGNSRNHAAQAFPTEVLRRLEELLPGDMLRTAETGCGKSTILFSNLSQAHLVFALDDRCHEAASSVNFFSNCPLTRIDRVSTIFGPTQKTLRTFEHQEYDCVLLDGPHGWPFPEFEYLMFYPHIKKGGHLIVDDCSIPTIARMADVLADDEMWQLIEVIGNNTALFRRTGSELFDPFADGWWTQKYNRKRVSRKRDIWLHADSVDDEISSLFLDRALHPE